MGKKRNLLTANSSDAYVLRKAKATSTVLFGSRIDYQKLSRDQLGKGSWQMSALSCASWLGKSIAEGLPFCHKRNIDNLSIEISLQPGMVSFVVDISGNGIVGIEMEAYGAAIGAALGAIDVLRTYDPDGQIRDCLIGEIDEDG